MNRLREIMLTACFLAVILGFSLLCLVHQPVAASEAERRTLAQMPDFSWGTVASGVFFSDFDKYATDQFPARDDFRSLKARFQLGVLGTKENNGLAIEDGYIARVSTSVNEASLQNAVEKFAYIYQEYLAEADTRNFMAIVPDKSWYFAAEYGYPAAGHRDIAQHMAKNLPEFCAIDIFDELTLTDYYRTDTHWRQDKILPVAEKILSAMCDNINNNTKKYKKNTEDYVVHEYYPFYGVYCGQSALDPESDTIYYLTNDVLDGCVVYDYETKREIPLYDVPDINAANVSGADNSSNSVNSNSSNSSKDAYDIFLGGTKALLRIDNPARPDGGELIIFRDSYGASLAPLLAEEYSSVILVDTRYVSSTVLGEYIDFNGQDVLLLYSTLLLNESFALK